MTALRNGTPIKTAENTFAVLPPNDLSQVTDSPFGMSTHFAWYPTWDVPLMSLLQQAGVKNVRDELYWNKVELQKGLYTFSTAYNNYMNGLQAHNINPFTLFGYTNQYYDQNSTPYSDEGRKGYADYGNAVLHQYGSIKWVEVYNEFNHPGFGDAGNGPADAKPEYYFNLLKQTYETIKAQNPNVTVVGCATSGIPMDWLEEVFKLGGLKYMDAISVHPYRYPYAPETLTGDLAKLKDLIKLYNGGNSLPVWISEMGWPTEQDSRGVSENVQAEYIVRSHVTALSEGVEKVFWYDFMNDGLNPTYNENNFGIIRSAGDAKGNYAPKPAYVAYAAMTKQLTGAAFSRKEDIGTDVYSYVFNSNGEDTRVVWSKDTKQIKVKTETPITVTDLMGGEDTLYPGLGGYVYLTISDSPLYIRGAVAGISEGDKFSLNSGVTATGDPINVTLSVDNTITSKGNITGSINFGENTSYFDVMPGKTLDVQITLPGENTPMTKTLYGVINIEGKPVAKLMTQVQIVDPVQLQVKHVLVNDINMLRATFNNPSVKGYTVESIDWQIGSLSGTQNASQTVQPGTGTNIDIQVPELPVNQTYSVALTVHVSGKQPVAYNGSIRLVSISDMKPASQKTIAVDGVLDDLSGAPYIDLADGVVKMTGYTGTEDLSGKVWLTWDKDNLYLSAKIHDDVFYQPAVADGIWQGDSIQFAVSQGMPGESKQWYEYGIALTGSGPQVYRWLAPTGKSTGLVNNAKLQVTRDENAKDTIYELALPWSELQPSEADDGLLSFSMLVNDNDGQGRKGWIEWGAGIGGAKDNKLFKPIYFVQPITSIQP
jgi:hypothetical protein